MDKIPDKIKKIIEQYFLLLKNNNIPISKAYLFGSYAKGNYHEWSDIDIALVSEMFSGDRFLDKNKIRKFSLEVSSELEILPFSKDDFTKSNPFAREIIETGIQLL